MQAFDLIIRNANVVTAADGFLCDIGIRDGRIVALGLGLQGAAQEVDAQGRTVTPGGIDSHVHLDQPTGDGSIMADDFESGTRSAACGGTTTVIPFACQQKGQTLRAAVEDYHRRADGRTDRLRLSPHRHRPYRGRPAPRASRADCRGLYVLQDLHDLRRIEAQ